MRILYIIGCLGAGGDTSAVLTALNTLLSEQKLRAEEVDFLTHDIGYSKDCADRLRKNGHGVYVLPGDVRKMGIPGYYKAVKRFLKEHGPYDVMHIHTSMQSGVAMLAAKRCGVKKRICHSHVNSIQRKTSAAKEKVAVPIFRKLINRSVTDRVACGQMAGEFLFEKQEFKILKNGIPLDDYLSVTEDDIKAMRKALCAKDGELLIGHIGRFSEMKNQRFILRLAEIMKDDNVRFVLAGDGGLLDELKTEAEGKNLPVSFLGRRSDIPLLASSLDALVLPSLPGEGFPTVLVEAQAAGCPCVVSTCVTREADLGLGLVSFEELANEEGWRRLILSAAKQKTDRSRCAAAVKALGYDKKDAAEKWYSLYRG